MLHDSLHNKLLALADHVLVYPAHGAGSLCGRNMRAERSSTIGTERLTNYALQIKSRAEFIRQLTTNLPTRPEYFLQDAEINRQGAPALTDIAEVPAITAAELKAMLDEGAVALDVRAGDQFAQAHVPGSINIALSGQFASWAGTVLGLSARPILIAENTEQLSEARLRLARVGIENVAGYLNGGIAAWKQAGFALAETPQITVQDLRQCLKTQASQVLDVRREPEWNAAHIEGAAWWPLDNFKISPPEIDHDQPVAVHCKSGYRSMIACSLLQRAGFRNVINVIGGFDAWQEAKFPVQSETAVEA
jgi:rhodanese-related sulfurtransferase